MIEIVTSGQTRSAVAREILEGLTDWFEIPETREKYIADAAHQLMAAAWDGDRPVGFLCLEETGRDTMEIAVMGVARDHHRQGIGRGLFAAAKREDVQDTACYRADQKFGLPNGEIVYDL